MPEANLETLIHQGEEILSRIGQEEQVLKTVQDSIDSLALARLSEVAPSVEAEGRQETVLSFEDYLTLSYGSALTEGFCKIVEKEQANFDALKGSEYEPFLQVEDQSGIFDSGRWQINTGRIVPGGPYYALRTQNVYSNEKDMKVIDYAEIGIVLPQVSGFMVRIENRYSPFDSADYCAEGWIYPIRAKYKGREREAWEPADLEVSFANFGRKFKERATLGRLAIGEDAIESMVAEIDESGDIRYSQDYGKTRNGNLAKLYADLKVLRKRG